MCESRDHTLVTFVATLYIFTFISTLNFSSLNHLTWVSFCGSFFRVLVYKFLSQLSNLPWLPLFINRHSTVARIHAIRLATKNIDTFYNIELYVIIITLIISDNYKCVARALKTSLTTWALLSQNISLLHQCLFVQCCHIQHYYQL